MSVSVSSRVEVEVKGSSLIQKIAYSKKDRQLSVELKGNRQYHYVDVPESEALAFMEADSHGGYFAANIKDAFECYAE